MALVMIDPLPGVLLRIPWEPESGDGFKARQYVSTRAVMVVS